MLFEGAILELGIEYLFEVVVTRLREGGPAVEHVSWVYYNVCEGCAERRNPLHYKGPKG